MLWPKLSRVSQKFYFELDFYSLTDYYSLEYPYKNIKKPCPFNPKRHNRIRQFNCIIFCEASYGGTHNNSIC